MPVCFTRSFSGQISMVSEGLSCMTIRSGRLKTVEISCASLYDLVQAIVNSPKSVPFMGRDRTPREG